MKKNILFMAGALLFLPLSSFGQLTLEECQQKARDNYPLAQQYGLIEKIEEYSLSNAAKGYLPQLSLSAKASYQSDVTQIPIAIPGINIKGMSKDQYQAVLELNQTIWDGGNIRASRSAIRQKSAVDKQQTAVSLYAVNERVNQLFFGTLLLEEQIKQNELLQNELKRSYEQVKAYLTNGIASTADLDAVRVEQLNTAQKRKELESLRQTYGEMLSALIHEKIEKENGLSKPSAEKYETGRMIRRPELSWFDAQLGQLNARQQQIDAGNLPRIGFFVQGGYGNPGLNLLKDEFTPYYIAGLKLNWNFGSLYTRKNEKRSIELNRSQIGVQQETFLFNTRLEMTQSNNEIEKLSQLMKSDNEIIALRHNIRLAAEAKVANGTLTVTEMLRELTAEDLARQNKILHEIQRLMAIYQLKYITNH